MEGISRTGKSWLHCWLLHVQPVQAGCSPGSSAEHANTELLWLCLLKTPNGLVGKESACNAGDTGSIPGSGRTSGGGNGNSLRYSCLKNPMDKGAWWATVHDFSKSQTWLSDWAHTYTCTNMTILQSVKVTKNSWYNMKLRIFLYHLYLLSGFLMK